MTFSGGSGIRAGMLCRKRYADDAVSAAITAVIDQLVVLGAGLDTRAYRLATPGGHVTAFELDLPANISYKRERLKAAYGRVSQHVRLIPIDFETDDLGDRLTENGYLADRPAIFVWEAVTQYLTEDGVRRTLRHLSRAAAGSRLIFTYVRKDFLDSTRSYDAERAYHEYVIKHRIWHFGMNPDDVGPLLREYGWTEREQVSGADYLTRYLQPTGREMPVSPVERFVSADKHWVGLSGETAEARAASRLSHARSAAGLINRGTRSAHTGRARRPCNVFPWAESHPRDQVQKVEGR